MNHKDYNYWKCKQCTKTGQNHQKRNMLCQDRIVYKCRDGKQVGVLVDGCGSVDLNVLGGERIAERIAEMMLCGHEENMNSGKKQVIYSIFEEIFEEIGALADTYDVALSEFKSTIIAVCIDHTTDTYCAVHLGDGIIIKVNDSGETMVMSHPRNGFLGGETYLTTSPSAPEKMKVFRDNLGNISEIFLCSDGVYDLDNSMDMAVRCSEDLKKYGVIMEEREDDQGIILLQR